jgi:adenylate cyclase
VDRPSAATPTHSLASVRHGFEYDIFISYRHNDNLDGWVTDFVQNLEKELRSTIKEPLSVYFDKNPHDGLGDTHLVDKSLEGKLRCLIFIPVLSQTYCDPKSFAWQHEFCAFNRLAQADGLGKEIKVINRNIASRILPVRIHDLDASDKTIIEKETGGPVRAIEFIFSGPGVNRPLTSIDKREENQNRTVFRDQVNKTANAIKEIIQAVTSSPSLPREASMPEQNVRQKKPQLARKVVLASLLLLIVTAAYFLLGGFPKDESGFVDRSIAVLPFVNMSNDPEQEYFSDGISEEILNVLAKVSELKVIGRTSSFYFKGKNEDLRAIGEKLNVGHLLEGSVRKDGNMVRITAQLIRTSDGSHLWNETYERKMENVFQLQDEIAAKVLKQLRIRLLGDATTPLVRNSDVQKLLLQGRYAFNQADYLRALGFYEKAIALDSGDAYIWTSLAQVNAILGNGNFDQFERRSKFVKVCAQKALSIDKNFSDAHRLKGLSMFYYDFKWEEATRELNLAIQLDSNNSDAYRNLAQVERALGQFDKAKSHLEKSIDLNPLNYVNVSNLMSIYMAQSQYEAAEKVAETLTVISPDPAKVDLIYLYILSNKLDKAEELIPLLPASFNESDKGAMGAMIRFKRGQKAEAVQLLNKLIEPSRTGSFVVARLFAFMEQPDEAFLWLDKAYNEKYQAVNIKWSPFLNSIRNDSRYTALLKKMNLPSD